MNMDTTQQQKGTTARPVNWPAQQQGATGEDVRTVQYLLNDHGATVGVDGTFGHLTSQAVRAFQADHGLDADGIVGNVTWPELATQVSFGSMGDAVRAAQRQMNRRTGRIAIDGLFRGKTNDAVRSFQRTVGLPVDGAVGPKTWNALVTDYLTSDDGQAAALATFRAWTHNDQNTAQKNATPNAIRVLFEREWRRGDGWTLDGCDRIAGRFHCTWSGKGEKLVIESNDNSGGGPFYFVDKVIFESVPSRS